MEQGYIKIPTIKSVKVKNYPLFDYKNKDYWEFDISNGVNLLLGANSIGKTTTMNMIIFAFVGIQKDITQIDLQYFSERLKLQERNKANQYITLEFFIGEDLISICRNLRGDGKLKSFMLNNIEQDIVEYEKYIEKATQMTMQELCKLLQFMLIREEEGNYILWDITKQTEIISILLNKTIFYREFSKNKNIYKKIDNKSKKLKNRVYNEKKHIKTLREKQQKQLIERSDNSNINNLDKKKDKLLLDSKNLKEDKKNKYKDLKQLRNEDEEIYKRFINIRSKLQENESYLQELNKRLNNFLNSEIDNIYDNSLKLGASKMKDYHHCIFCDNDISKSKANKIFNKYVINKQCPVCDSSIGSKETEKSIQTYEENIEEIDKIKKEIKKFKKEYKNTEDNKIYKEEEVKKQQKQIILIEKQVHNTELELKSINKQLDILKQNKSIEFTDYDMAIKQIEENTQELNKEYQNKEKEKSLFLNKLNKQIIEYNKNIKKFTNELNNIFKRYAKKYFIDNCELTIYTASSFKKNSIDNTVYFIPKLKDEKRIKKNQVSQFERIFLEYLFRVSILELYFKTSETKPFLFLETSEGVFDTANTSEIAKLFSSFGNEKFPIIIVANLSKVQDFLTKLFKDEKEREQKTFNLINYGKLTSKQKEHPQLKLYLESESY